MTPDERKDLIRRANDELWNKGNYAICDELFASNCSFHLPAFPVEGTEGLKQQVRELREANQDLHVDVHDVLCDGDLTSTRFTMAGTATGEFRGIPATGKTFVMSGITISKWDDEKIVEEWTDYNLMGALQQLGVLPEMAAPSTGE